MNIRDLHYLVAVAKTQHFGKAAENCFVSQPTLSTQLKKLEEELGIQLFERTNKQVMVTAIGQQIIDEAQQTLNHIEQIKQLAKNNKNPFAGQFKLGIIPTLGPYLLPYILDPIKQHLPELELVVLENKTSVILEKLKKGELDAIILALPLSTQGLTSKQLFLEPFYVLLPKAHELAKDKVISMQQLNKQNLLLLEEGHCLREQALEACRYPTARAEEFSATSLETLRQLVGLGTGITLLPALAVASIELQNNVVIRPIADKTPAREVGLLWRDSSVRKACCQKIADIIQQSVRNCKALSFKNIKPLTTPLN